MPFGLTNALATFQSVMNDLLRPYLRKFVLVFIDDILIYSGDWQDHVEHLRIVMSLLQTHSYGVNPKKCAWGQSEVECLGHVVSASGVQMDPGKIAAILRWPIPKTIKGIRGFLGLTGYYRRFIGGYGQLVRPLTQLFKKEHVG